MCLIANEALFAKSTNTSKEWIVETKYFYISQILYFCPVLFGDGCCLQLIKIQGDLTEF